MKDVPFPQITGWTHRQNYQLYENFRQILRALDPCCAVSVRDVPFPQITGLTHQQKYQLYENFRALIKALNACCPCEGDCDCDACTVNCTEKFFTDNFDGAFQLSWTDLSAFVGGRAIEGNSFAANTSALAFAGESDTGIGCGQYVEITLGTLGDHSGLTGGSFETFWTIGIGLRWNGDSAYASAKYQVVLITYDPTNTPATGEMRYVDLYSSYSPGAEDTTRFQPGDVIRVELRDVDEHSIKAYHNGVLVIDDFSPTPASSAGAGLAGLFIDWSPDHPEEEPRVADFKVGRLCA